jgi:hypothetical protein
VRLGYRLAIWIVKLLDAVAPRLSVTRTVKVYVPRLVGVPEIVPPELKVRPFGSEPDVRLHE